ncbi:tripartite motif-containing protein 2-like [Ptychodera flava]|uniref:tripartite motif-containing protein 2-like n=1 Tax=Ptychodera flava TaxID=63121 RepID=UPI003969EE66
MKIELPTVSDDAKENQQHIEVHVEIKTGDDDDDKIAEQVKEQASDDVQSKRPQSQVMFDEQVVRQIEQKGTEGSVSSRASSAVAVPRTMIQGRSWGSSSRASAKQVLQNVASNGEVGQQRRHAKRKAELVFEFGQRGTSAGRLRRPHGVAVSANSDIIVCDSGNHRVQIFGWDCKYKTKWSPDTLRRRLFSRDRFDPGDVAVTPDNKHFIVTDFSTERLYKVSLETHHSKEFGKSGYKGPWGVAINSHGYIYISYCISNCVVCYTSDGKFVHTIGRKGVGPAEFSYPCYLAINKRDAIIVAEYHNRRVQILNPDGEFMFQIGSSEHFREISGVAVDNFNNVFVADYKCHRVVMYGNDGAFKLCIGDQEDKLDRPEGVAISHDGYIVVSDSGSHGVKIFRHWDVKKLFDSM